MLRPENRSLGGGRGGDPLCRVCSRVPEKKEGGPLFLSLARDVGGRFFTKFSRIRVVIKDAEVGGWSPGRCPYGSPAWPGPSLRGGGSRKKEALGGSRRGAYILPLRYLASSPGENGRGGDKGMGKRSGGRGIRSPLFSSWRIGDRS